MNARTLAPRPDDRFARFWAIVRRIPRGRVATYGQIARLAGLPRHARLVGRALAAVDDESIPWHRVVNARGEISARAMPGCDEDVQRALLEREGVEADARGRLDLVRYRWSAGSA